MREFRHVFQCDYCHINKQDEMTVEDIKAGHVPPLPVGWLIITIKYVNGPVEKMFHDMECARTYLENNGG